MRMHKPRITSYSSPRLAPPGKVSNPLYGSPAWRQLRAAVVEAAGGVCQGCGARGVRLYGDHVVELRDDPGRALEPSNVAALCAKCHGKKTAQQRADRRFTVA